MNIEDIVISLMFSPVKLNRYDQPIIMSFTDQVNQGRGFTEKQRSLSLKILKRYKIQLQQVLNQDLSIFLENPTFRLPLRVINSDKKLLVSDSDSMGKCISVIFPYNDEYVQKIRKSRDQIDDARWDKETKSWIFSLSEKNIKFLFDLIKEDQFELDENFENFKIQIQNIQQNFEKYVPMLALENNELKFVNFPSNLPNLESKDIISALFEARKKGISTWDDNIGQYLQSNSINPITKVFLESDPADTIQVDGEKYDITSLIDIVKYLSPCLFIIPGGQEAEKLKLVYNFLIKNGFSYNELSVMFRLPSSEGKEFNEFIKNCSLNNPVTDNTKVVFVSGKLPKPVISSKIKFHSVINLGFQNVHYTLRDFAKNHENLVVYSEQSKQKEFRFELV